MTLPLGERMAAVDPALDTMAFVNQTIGSGGSEAFKRKTDSSYYHASTLQTLPINNFVSCLEWSNDGQAFAITRVNIYLLTPILGYAIDPENINSHSQNLSYDLAKPAQDITAASASTPLGTQGNPSNSSLNQNHLRPQIPFFTTSIEVDKHAGVNWTSHSNDISTMTPPCVDRFWRTATWSPSGLSTLGSCLIAGMTSNSDVFVFVPSRNFQSSLWEMNKSMNLCEELLSFFFQSYGSFVNDQGVEMDVTPETGRNQSAQANAKRERFTSCVLRTQATCLAWSPAYSNCDQPVASNEMEALHDVDFSLLALGHRRGDLSLWRHVYNGNMELVFFNPICLEGQTINLLRWSDWTLTAKEPRDSASATGYQLLAYLAVATSQGVIYILRVYRPFERAKYGVSPVNCMEIETCGVYRDESNQSAITCLRWMEGSAHTPPALIFSRLGQVVLFKVPAHPSGEMDTDLNHSDKLASAQIIDLPELQDFDDRLCWADCNSWVTCSGISTTLGPSPGLTWILVTLSNGLVFLMQHHKSDSNSAVARFELDIERSIQLSLDFRAKFRMIGASLPSSQNVKITQQYVMKTYGSTILKGLDPLSDNKNHSFDVGGTTPSSGCIMSWLFEIDAPNKFLYKPENRQFLQFALAHLDLTEHLSHSGEGHSRMSNLLAMLDAELQSLRRLLQKPIPCIRVSPTMTLFTVYLATHVLFSDPLSGNTIGPMTSLMHKMMKLMEVENLPDVEPSSMPSSSIISMSELRKIADQLVPHSVNTLAEEESSTLRLSSLLIGELFDNEYLDRLRLRSNLCSFLLSKIDKVRFTGLRTELVDIKVKLSRLTHSEILRIITRFFHTHQTRLSHEEKEVSERYHYATQIINQFPEPTLEQLLEPEEIDHKLLDQDRLQNTYLGQSIESCPACQHQIAFDNMRFGICELGHVWDRCSVTFQILATIKLRTCVGCGRKALQRPLRGEDGSKVLLTCGVLESSEDSMIEILLDCARCCLHCGCRWKHSS